MIPQWKKFNLNLVQHEWCFQWKKGITKKGITIPSLKRESLNHEKAIWPNFTDTCANYHWTNRLKPLQCATNMPHNGSPSGTPCHTRTRFSTWTLSILRFFHARRKGDVVFLGCTRTSWMKGQWNVWLKRWNGEQEKKKVLQNIRPETFLRVQVLSSGLKVAA